MGLIVFFTRRWLHVYILITWYFISYGSTKLILCHGGTNVIPMTQAVATSTNAWLYGVLMGPALIGFIAHGTSLTVAFIIINYIASL